MADGSGYGAGYSGGVPSTSAPGDRIFKRIQARCASARLDRDRHRGLLDEIFRWCMPWRPRFGEQQRNPDQVEDIFDSTAETTLQDFAASMQSGLTPMEGDWLDIVPQAQYGLGALRQLEGPLRQFREAVFGEMRRSNFYEAAAEAYLDLGHGTMGMVIEDIGIDRPIHCQAVPATELLIDRGAYSDVDARFRVLRPRYAEIETLWPDAKIGSELRRKIEDAPEARCEVVEGLVRDLKERGDQAWDFCVWIVDDKLVERRLIGDGSAPLVVARWRTDSVSAWGIGPLYTSIADVKTANKLVELVLKNAEFSVNPAVTGDDDGVINVSNGIMPGDYIPRARGSKIDLIPRGERFDVGYIELERLQENIRRALYQDGPKQVGKTPPTATQWLEEQMQLARRIGAPFGRLVTEWQFQVFNRFYYILAQRGKLPEVKLNGNDIGLQVQSPLLRAQKQEGALRASRFLEMIMPLGPPAVAMLVNGPRYADEIRRSMSVPIDVLNTPEEIQAMVDQATQAATAAAEAGMAPT